MNPVPHFVEVQTPLGVPCVPPAGLRLPRFFGCEADAPVLLAALRVAVIGCGSIGSRVAEFLARLAIQALWLVDSKVFKRESLLTHAIGAAEVGQPKAPAIGRRCKELSPGTRVWAFDGPVQTLPLDALADADVVVLASDNLPCEVEVGQRCLHLSRPLVQGAVHGETLTAVVRFFGAASGPCPRCLFGEDELAALRNDSRFSCEPSGVAAAPQPAVPTLSLNALCSLAADLVTLQLVKHALRLGAPVHDSLLEFNAFSHRSVLTPIRRNPACACDHQPWRILSSTRPLAESSPALLFAQAGCDDQPGCDLTVAGYYLAEASLCRCAMPLPMLRFVPSGSTDAGLCPLCHERRVVPPFYAHTGVLPRLLGTALHQPLRALGVPAVSAVLVQDSSGRATLLREAALPGVNSAPLVAALSSSTNPSPHPL
jgi:molybdopterin/thiamine biosynthesis adenylyltransferase